MHIADHARVTAASHGPATGLLATLPDLGVPLQRLPSPTIRRWAATWHHSTAANRVAARIHPALGTAWKSHYDQDEASHPAGTYKPRELVGIPAQTVVAYSGGPDSFIAWRMLGCPPGVYVNVGNASSGREMAVVRQADRRFAGAAGIRVWNAPVMHELPTGWIPYRNLQLILACSQVSPNVVLARIAEWGPDKNPLFFRRVERLLADSRGGYFQAAAHVPKVRVFTPFGHLTKTALVRRYLEEFGRDLGVHDLTTYTRSCYAGTEQFCGECTACVSRWIAFTSNGIDESGRYERTPRVADFTRRLDLRDASPRYALMYWKRWREMHPYAGRPES